MKKLLIILLVTVIVFGGATALLGGNRADTVTCEVFTEGVPEGTKYIELLVISKEMENATNCNKNYCDELNIPYDSEIVKLNFDGYASYTYHTFGATYSNAFKEENGMCEISFCDGSVLNSAANYSSVRFAYVDKDGEVLKVSDAFDMTKYIGKNILKLNDKEITQKVRSFKYSSIILTGVAVILLELFVFYIIVIYKDEKKKKSQPQE
ncbi:MAG: hypothetical protein ACI4IF_00820 [Acutalibacteraceae bacterium]